LLTVFSLPKPFVGHFDVIQRNAIRSWTELRPTCEIILMGNEEGTRDVAREFGVRNLPEIAHNEFGTPRVDSIFEQAEEAARHPILCYVNADIILMNDFMGAVQQVANHQTKFMMSGQRWNLDVDNLLDFQPDWEDRLRSVVADQGQLYVRTGLDYFVYPRGLLGKIPPFAVGRTSYDQWLLYRARTLAAPLIDATPVVMCVHQNHDYSHHPEGSKGIWHGPEAKRNLELAGGRAHLFIIKDRTHVLTPRGSKRALDAWRIWRLLRTAQALYPSLPLPMRPILYSLNRAIDAVRALFVWSGFWTPPEGSRQR